MAIEKHQRIVEVYARLGEDGEIKHCMMTVDDGYMEDGVFSSGQIRKIEADKDTVAKVFKDAVAVTETHVLALRDEKNATIKTLTDERDEANRKIEQALKALQ